ncbi:uncharacterized protein PITG_01008 [Phytophthora infestans T30-4]|uniref:Uncharacterized protein n=1 Tax=Phytophthora infestans (strain T30-4) TaxID=403677 RepID=D0MS83_PHYIT|nr:uncharacterized protein PITG_01008 [Phytophthora infestans T30-4]EEY58352.1 conserved hypothetical protein [Phytophthora infestans T30-4]|eukprot:XP_002909538.1 conserved hypothetical protein [Phytophthora infestans T30-4]
MATLDVPTLHSRRSSTKTLSRSVANGSKSGMLLRRSTDTLTGAIKGDDMTPRFSSPSRESKFCSKAAREMPNEGSITEGTNFSSLTIFSTNLVATMSRCSVNCLPSHSGPSVASLLEVSSSSKAWARGTSSFKASSASRIAATSALNVRPILPLFGLISTIRRFSGLSNLCVPTILTLLFLARSST